MGGGSGSKARKRRRGKGELCQDDEVDDSQFQRQIGCGADVPDDESAPFNDLTGYATIALATIIAYFPVFSAGFVWDDVIFTEAPQVLELGGIYDIWFRPAAMQEIHYWPLTYTSFWLEYRIWGLDPFGYHLTNVILHIANACLVRNVLRRMGVVRDGAWLTALVFAIHPLNVESVAWAIERKDVLSGFFYLSALLLHPNIDAAGPPEPSLATKRACLLSLVAYVLAMLSKTSVVSLPAVLLLVPWSLRGRIGLNELRNAELFFAAGMALAAFDVSLARAGEPVDFGFSLVERVLIASRAVCFYASKIVWPGVQMVIYPRWNLEEDDGTWFICFLVPAVSLLGLFAFRGRLGRGPVASLLFFAGTLFPVLGFIDYGFMDFSFVADRFSYLASLGPICCLSAVVVRRSGTRGPQTAAVTMVVIALLGSRTWQHASIYHDQESFYSHIVRVNPEAKAAHLNLGNELLRQKRHAESELYYQKAIAMEANNTKALINYGIVLSALEKHEETIRVLERAVALKPRSLKALNALGNAMSATGRYADAVKYFRAALEIDANYAIGWGNMGNDFMRMGQHEEAVKAYQAAIKIRPTYTNARNHLAIAFSKLGRHGEAIAQLQELLDYDPTNQVANEKLAAEMANLKK